jgi:predicted RecA/RadA family phage recombinase
MAIVKVKFAPAWRLMLSEDAFALAKADLAAGKYVDESGLFAVDGDSEDAAEDAFDLTNNPGRQFEREQEYGRGRSISSGDIVVVGEEQWLCMSVGWKLI